MSARERSPAGNGQVFGLAGTASPKGVHLLAVASRTRSGPVRMTAVVPAHRCGAVPDFHRVPSYDASRLADGANQLHGSA